MVKQGGRVGPDLLGRPVVIGETEQYTALSTRSIVLFSIVYSEVLDPIGPDLPSRWKPTHIFSHLWYLSKKVLEYYKGSQYALNANKSSFILFKQSFASAGKNRTTPFSSNTPVDLTMADPDMTIRILGPSRTLKL